jgi:hypothetical protein
MSAASYDLYIEQGATFRFTMIYGYKDGTLDSAGNANVVAYDITGCAVRMQIRARRGGEVLISATTSNGGIVITDPVNGKLQVTITDEATDSLTSTRAKYDLEISYPSGDVYRIIEGKVTISPNITQDADAANISTGVATTYDTDEQDVDMDTLVTDQPSTAF